MSKKRTITYIVKSLSFEVEIELRKSLKQGRNIPNYLN